MTEIVTKGVGGIVLVDSLSKIAMAEGSGIVCVVESTCDVGHIF